MKGLSSISKLVETLGASTAAVYVSLYDLYRKQRRLQGHFHAGRYWVQMPYKDFPQMFQFLSEDVVSKALRKLEDEGLLSIVHCDSLSWYAINRKPFRRVV